MMHDVTADVGMSLNIATGNSNEYIFSAQNSTNQTSFWRISFKPQNDVWHDERTIEYLTRCCNKASFVNTWGAPFRLWVSWKMSYPLTRSTLSMAPVQAGIWLLGSSLEDANASEWCLAAYETCFSKIWSFDRTSLSFVDVGYHCILQYMWACKEFKMTVNRPPRKLIRE